MTLVEMLVVLAIIGVMAGVTVLGMGSVARGASAESEARRLADRIQLAADESLVGNRAMALAGDATGYGFVAWDGRGWRAAAGDAFDRHALPAGFRLSLPSRGPLAVGMETGGLPFVARLAGAGQSWTIAYDGLSVTALPVPAT